MKKTLLIIILALVSLTNSYAQKGFSIEGKIKGIEDGKKISLTLGSTHKQEKPMFETKVTNGKFTFIGQLEGPRLFFLSVEGTFGISPFSLKIRT